MNTFHPEPWSGFLAECGLYLLFAGLLHLAVFIAGSLALALVSVRQGKTFFRRVSRFGLFLGLLLIVGSIFNGFWSCAIWGRFYFSTDYVIDFNPFWPITQDVIDAPFAGVTGQLMKVSLFQLQLIWLLFAVGTWSLAIGLYRVICRRLPNNSGSAAMWGDAALERS